MESISKRRKISHNGSDAGSHGLIDFEARSSAQLSAASTFVLQTDELLKESRIDYSRTFDGADGLLRQIKDIVESIEPHDAIPIAEATVQLVKSHRIIVPYPDPPPPKDAQYKVSFVKPSQCNVVGSYVLTTMVKTQHSMAIDMVVQMSESLFQDKDYMDMRYFYRRSYYLAYVAAHVRKELGKSVELAFEHLHENSLLPVLVIRPRSSKGDCRISASPGKHSVGYAIRLIVCASDCLFPWSKLTPSSKRNRQQDGTACVPSCFYNSTLNAEQTFISYLRLLVHAKSECPAFTDACMLGRTWLQQRGFGGGLSQGGFGHFEWAVTMALLLSTETHDRQTALSTSLSSTELFKAVIQFLSTTEFLKKPVVFGASTVHEKKDVREEGPVMFDEARQLNILYKMTPWSMALLQLYAKSTTDLLADEAVDKFDALFIIKANTAPLVFDAYLEYSTRETADRRSLSLKTYRILRRAYGSRAQLIHLSTPQRGPWPLDHGAPKDARSLTIAVMFQPAEMSRTMEYGPSAEEQKEAAAFRQFWGDKAELRRFKDGRILECVEWKAGMPLAICHEILCYSLGRHMGVSRDELVVRGPDLQTIIKSCHGDKEAFDAARRAFTALERQLRSLDDMPLQLRQLSPVSPMASYSSIEVPMPVLDGDSVQVMDVNVYFEASSKWPENLVAIQEAKVEFLLDIDRRLTTGQKGITTSLGRENRNEGIENLAYLDIVYDSGAAFRLRIHCDVEESLLERQVHNKTLQHSVRQACADALDGFCWMYKTLPLHTQMVATMCTRLDALSLSMRLVKCWFSSHRLSGHFSEQLIELFVLRVFVEPYPWPVPTSATTGLLRTLFFLSRWDWRDEPLVIDPADSLTPDDGAAIRSRVEAWRKRQAQSHGAVLFVATPSEPSGLAYTRKGPCRLVASRMTRLAKAACRLMRSHAGNLDAAALFECSLHDFDVLIHLAPKTVRAAVCDAASDHHGGKRHSHFKNLNARPGSAPLPVRAHPIHVLAAELQRVYDDTLIFFAAGGQDSVLAAIWNPRLPPRQNFRAGLPYNLCTDPGAGEGQDDGHGNVVMVNRRAILLEIARVGGEMIERIEVLDDGDDGDDGSGGNKGQSLLLK